MRTIAATHVLAALFGAQPQGGRSERCCKASLLGGSVAVLIVPRAIPFREGEIGFARHRRLHVNKNQVIRAEWYKPRILGYVWGVREIRYDKPVLVKE